MPGQGRHWGFWVMVGILVVVSLFAVAFVWQTQQRAKAAQKAAEEERKRMRDQLLRDHSGVTFP